MRKFNKRVSISNHDDNANSNRHSMLEEEEEEEEDRDAKNISNEKRRQ